MLTESELNDVLFTALSTGGDFAELYFEDKDELTIKCTEGIIHNITTTTISGVGIYILDGTKKVYVHTSDRSFANLIKMAGKAAKMLKDTKVDGVSPIELSRSDVQNPNVVTLYPSTISHHEKIAVVKETYRIAKETGTYIRQLNLDYFDTDQRVAIVNSEGLYTADRRVTSRIRLQATADNGTAANYDWDDYVMPNGFEAFKENGAHLQFAKLFIKNLEKSLEAQPAPTGVFPVVFEKGTPGTFWHEACGHQLESTAIAGNRSDFTGMIGEKVASSNVTLIDDGTIPNLYGSAAIDDEGTPTQKNVLIEKGVLKGYLCDRLGGRRLGVSSTGSGRRQGYMFAPVARMTNTYLAAGNDDEEEMIRTIDKGVYVKRLGGGNSGREFSIEVKEGYWIENGEIAHQIKGFVLNDRGIDLIKKIDRVGSNVQSEYGSFCGAASGLCPVTSFQPRMRVTEMSIGGEHND